MRKANAQRSLMLMNAFVVALVLITSVAQNRPEPKSRDTAAHLAYKGIFEPVNYSGIFCR